MKIDQQVHAFLSRTFIFSFNSDVL